MSEHVGPIYDRQAYAGFFRRTTALVIDGFLLAGVWIGAPWIWYCAAPAGWVTTGSYYWVSFGVMVMALAYLIGFRLTTNGTPGYRIMGIHYAAVLSGNPAVSSLLFRAVLAIVLMWFFALDHLWILFDERKQAWHDKVSGFYVIKRDAEPVATGRIVRRVIEFMMLTFVVWEPAESDGGSNATT
ncbi:MAG: RDD family protein [bacterium]|nr:RDD family protein [bacterium]